jgi:hypothetical protein
MSREPFSHRIDCWVSERTANAIETIADARAMTQSAVMRELVALSLNQLGMMPQRPARTNGSERVAAQP